MATQVHLSRKTFRIVSLSHHWLHLGQHRQFARVQRDPDGSPNVKCPACGEYFRCCLPVGDDALENGEEVLPTVISQSHLFRLIDTATRAAVVLDRERRNLSTCPGYDFAALRDVYTLMAENQKFKLEDIHRALTNHSGGVQPSEVGMACIRYRYAPDGSSDVSFPNFARQLKPCVSVQG